MILYIDTTLNNSIELKLKDEQGALLAKKRTKTIYTQSEKLLKSIEQLLEKNNFKLSEIKEVRVNNQGGGFTALRIGVVTANALAYALGVPVKAFGDEPSSLQKNKKDFDVVEPVYSQEPNIS